jgi:hypothetical protein
MDRVVFTAYTFLMFLVGLGLLGLYAYILWGP